MLLKNQEVEEARKAVERIENLATKKYQQEDIVLMKCRLSILRGAAGETEREQLAALSKTAMMPQVRRDATEWLAKIGGMK